MKAINVALLFLTVFSLRFHAVGQNAQFLKIEYASFDVNSYRTPQKNKAFISLYAEIDSNGLVRIKKDHDYKNKNTCFSYTLSSEELKKVTAVFNPNKGMKTLVKEYKFKEGEEFFAGSYDFFIVTYKNGTKDSICTIAPFMLPSFEKVYSLLGDICYGDKKLKKITAFSPTDLFKKSLYSSYIKNKMLPQIKNPPPFRIEDQ